MKYILLPIFLFATITSFSQKSIIKGAKKELKYYRKHVQEYLYYKSECLRKDSVIEEQEVLIQNLSAQINMLNQKLIALQADANSNQVVDTRVMPSGTCYQVQIGVYKNTNLMQYLTEPKYVGYQLDQDLVRYHIGYFTNYIEAKNFLDIVRKMGIKDAFIAEYMNGERIIYTNNNPTATKKSDAMRIQKNWEYKEDEDGYEKIVVKPLQTTSTKVSSNEKPIKMQENWELSRDDDGIEVIYVNPSESSSKNEKKSTEASTNENIKMQENWNLRYDENGNPIIDVTPR